MLPVRPLARLTVRLLRRWVLPRLLRVLPLLAGIRRLRLASRGRLPVRLLLLPVLPGLRLPVRIGRILPVRRLLPVVTHADKISARHIRGPVAWGGLAELSHLHGDEHLRTAPGVGAAQRGDVAIVAAVTDADVPVG